jgi:putative membrane protein
VALLLFFAFLGVLTWLVLRRARPARPSVQDRGREILAERFARGELSVEEYRERMEELR